RGSSTLVVHGFAVTFDAGGLDYTNTAVGGTGWLAAQPVRTLRLLPGRHFWVTSAGTRADFKVTDIGQVDYDHSLDGLLSGRGGLSLVARGLGVAFDARGLDYTNTAIGGTGWLAVQSVRTLRLWPGAHRWVNTGGNGVDFKVTDTGRVDYDHGL